MTEVDMAALIVAFDPEDEDDAALIPPEGTLVSVGELIDGDLPDPEDTDISDTGVVLPLVHEADDAARR